MSNKKKAQSFSLEVMILVVFVMFVGIFFVVFLLDDLGGEDDHEEIIDEMENEEVLIYNELERREIIDQRGEVNLDRLAALDANELRQELGIRSHFAITLEHEDGLVLIDSQEGVDCIGTGEMGVSGNVC